MRQIACADQARSRMRCYGNDRDYRRALLAVNLVGTVAPEYPVSAGRLVLRVRFEYLHPNSI